MGGPKNSGELARSVAIAICLLPCAVRFSCRSAAERPNPGLEGVGRAKRWGAASGVRVNEARSVDRDVRFTRGTVRQDPKRFVLQIWFKPHAFERQEPEQRFSVFGKSEALIGSLATHQGDPSIIVDYHGPNACGGRRERLFENRQPQPIDK